MSNAITYDDLVAPGDFDNVIKTVKKAKQKRIWELEMLVDLDFDWQTAAKEELDRRAAAKIIDRLSSEDLKNIVIGDIDMNQLYREA